MEWARRHRCAFTALACLALFLVLPIRRADRQAWLRRLRPDDPADLQGPELPLPPADVVAAAAAGWHQLRPLLRRSTKRYVVVDAKNGLGNRLRALASGMAVSARLGRPLVLIWVADLHCNCSYRSMFAAPLPFALCDSEVDSRSISPRHFQLYNYMRPEPGAIKDEWVEVDPQRHLWFKSGFVMNHRFGHFRYAQYQMQHLTPAKMVTDLLVANRAMVGLHIRNVFDAPRDAATNKNTTGKKAIAEAAKEYGSEGTRQLLRWRKAGHWSNFMPKIREMLQARRACVAVGGCAW